jgi:hypothetical protein
VPPMWLVPGPRERRYRGDPSTAKRAASRAAHLEQGSGPARGRNAGGPPGIRCVCCLSSRLRPVARRAAVAQEHALRRDRRIFDLPRLRDACMGKSSVERVVTPAPRSAPAQRARLTRLEADRDDRRRPEPPRSRARARWPPQPRSRPWPRSQPPPRRPARPPDPSLVVASLGTASFAAASLSSVLVAVSLDAASPAGAPVTAARSPSRSRGNGS